MVFCWDLLGVVTSEGTVEVSEDSGVIFGFVVGKVTVHGVVTKGIGFGLSVDFGSSVS